MRQLSFKAVKYVPYKQMSNVYVSYNIEFNADGSVTVTKYVGDYEKEGTNKIGAYFTPTDKKCGAWHPFAIHRYMPFLRFKQDVENGCLSFLSPLKWRDPFENVFYAPHQIIGGATFDVRCICTTFDRVENEESAWARSGSSDDKQIRVTYKFDKLCRVLEQAAQEVGCKFYFSVVDYSQSKDNLIAANAQVYQTIDEYLNVLSLKRKAFSYENEIRIFAVFNKQVQNIVSVSVCANAYNDIVDCVTMPPLEPFLRDDPRFSIYDRLQDLDNLQLRKDLLNLGVCTRIWQSRLYSQIKGESEWINKIANVNTKLQLGTK